MAKLGGCAQVVEQKKIDEIMLKLDGIHGCLQGITVYSMVESPSLNVDSMKQ